MLKDVFVDGNGGWIGAAARYGVAIVIALLLTGFLVFRQETALAQIDAVVVANGQKMSSAQVQMSAFVMNYERTAQEMLKLQRQTCVNTAKNDDQRMSCLK